MSFTLFLSLCKSPLSLQIFFYSQLDIIYFRLGAGLAFINLLLAKTISHDELVLCSPI